MGCGAQPAAARAADQARYGPLHEADVLQRRLRDDVGGATG